MCIKRNAMGGVGKIEMGKCRWPVSLSFPSGLGFRQLGSRTYLMVATIAAVYAITIGDPDKKVRTDSHTGRGELQVCFVC